MRNQRVSPFSLYSRVGILDHFITIIMHTWYMNCCELKAERNKIHDHENIGIPLHQYWRSPCKQLVGLHAMFTIAT